MKKPFRLAAALATLAFAAPGGLAPAFAQSEHESHHIAQAEAPAAASALADGTVKKVDKAAGKITISHGPLDSLGMPPMTMVFRAADPAMLEQVKAGDRIRFAAERAGGAFTVTALEVVR
jgi:Cu/Ag efflux protein CusF